MKELNRFLNNYRFQMFTEGGEPGAEGGAGGAGSEPKTFSQEDVDKLLAEQKGKMEKDFDSKFNKKFAEYKAKAKEEADEAARLAQMTAQEKAEAERDKLQKELDELKAENTRNGMRTEARKILKDQGVTISDELLNMIVSSDAETTQKAVNSFAEMYKTDLANAVKSALAGEPPKTGGTNTITKEEIMKVKDRVQRQKLIAEHPDLFK